MGDIVGQERTQSTLCPQALEEYVAAENPVRFIEAFVEELDLAALGFTKAVAKETGRPGDAPGDLRRLYIYGYLNRVRASRLLERETQRNVEVMWLIGKLPPECKPIADFRKDNLQALKAVGREFTLLCKRLELLGGEVVAIDGSKFKAVNNRKRNFTQQKLERAIREIERKIEGYLKERDQADKEGSEGKTPTAEALKGKIAQLRDRKQKYQGLAQELKQRGETPVSFTAPDSRSRPVGHATEVCSNVQTAVDAKPKLIVAHAVTNAVTDQGQLAEMALRAQATLEVEQLEVGADRGYCDGEEVKKGLAAGRTPSSAKPTTSANKKRGLDTKEEFPYDQANAVYRCPQGAELTDRFDTVELGRHLKYYATPSC
jgi:transposase